MKIRTMLPSPSFVAISIVICCINKWPTALKASEAFAPTPSFLTPLKSAVVHPPNRLVEAWQVSLRAKIPHKSEVSPRISPKLHATIESTTVTVSSSRPSLTAEDFSDIQPLEEELKATLIPSPFGPDEYLPTVHELISSLDENISEKNRDDQRKYREDVAKEVYIRLGRVYGFPHFNYYSPPPDILSQNNHLVGANHNNDSTTLSRENEFENIWLPSFDKIKLLHLDPLVLQVDDFFTSEECDSYIKRSLQEINAKGGDVNRKEEEFSSPPPLAIGQSQTVGQDEHTLAKRTSHTWFHHYCGVPELMTKASRLLGLDYEFNYFGKDYTNKDTENERSTLLDCWEEPQTVRYQPNQKFTWHYDVLDPKSMDKLRNDGGQRIATLLVYLNEMDNRDGGATLFRDLGSEEMVPLRM
ncbi:hypothetical protein ACHAXS_008911 [Conticribra weissflogii]